MRKNGKTNAVGRGGALLRPAGYTELSKIFGESVCTYPRGRRGRCPHRPGRMHRFYGNLRRICTFSMGRQSRRPLQQPFALSVGEDDSVRPRDVPILRESSANSQLPNGAMCASPPTSKEVTACASAVPVGDIVCLLVSLTARSCRRCGGTGARHGCWKCRSGT